jgi:hypothetical protein
MDVEFNCQLDWGHRTEDVDLVLAFECLVGGVHDIAVEVELEVVSSRVIAINKTQQKVPLTLCEILIRSPRLQTINQVLI